MRYGQVFDRGKIFLRFCFKKFFSPKSADDEKAIASGGWIFEVFLVRRFASDFRIRVFNDDGAQSIDRGSVIKHGITNKNEKVTLSHTRRALALDAKTNRPSVVGRSSDIAKASEWSEIKLI